MRDGANFGYDIIAHIGRARFLEHKQREEIQLELKKEKGIDISTGEISNLGVAYLVYHKCVHDESLPILKKAIYDRGGYFFHIDCTQEGGSDLVFMGLAYIPGMGTIVLRSDRIETESEESIIPLLWAIKDDFGDPLMITRDMGKGFRNAHREVFSNVPGHICRTHLVKDVTKDILNDQYVELKKHMGQFKVRTTLVNVHFESETHLNKAGIVWKRKNAPPPEFDVKNLFIHWAYETWHLTALVLGYTRDDNGYDFPFGFPYVNLYKRCMKMQPEVKRLLHTVVKANKRYDPLMELHSMFRTLFGNSERAFKLNSLYRKIMRVRPIIDELRRITGIQSKEPTVEGVKNAQAGLERELLSLKKKLKIRSMAKNDPDARECKIVAEHIEKYWDELVSMVWVKDPENPEKVIAGLPENNIEEEKFKDMKSDRRRTTGKKHVIADINYYGPYLSYQLSFRNEEYVRLLYDSLDTMAIRFSRVDPVRFREELMKFVREKKGPQRIYIEEQELITRFHNQLEHIDMKLDEERYLRVSL